MIAMILFVTVQQPHTPSRRKVFFKPADSRPEDGLMSFHTTFAIAYCYDHSTIGPSLSALLCEIVKSSNCVYIERREACTFAICKIRPRRSDAIEATAITAGPVRKQRTIPKIAFDFPHAISLG